MPIEIVTSPPATHTGSDRCHHIAVITSLSQVVQQAASSVSDKVKNRLEQLDDAETGNLQELLDLNQQEYV